MGRRSSETLPEICGADGGAGQVTHDGGPAADLPVGDEAVADVGVIAGELFGDGGRVGEEQQHRPIHGIGEGALQHQFTPGLRLPGAGQMFGPIRTPPGGVIGAGRIEEQIVVHAGRRGGVGGMVAGGQLHSATKGPASSLR